MSCGHFLNPMQRDPEDQSIKERFPAWSEVWHRADHRKGIVDGWHEEANGSEQVHVCWGSEGTSNEYPEMLLTEDPEFIPELDV
jgi:hypothetical protein